VTDLKTATQQLTEALAALESTEHAIDVQTAEAHRNLLLELDAKMAARIQAKLQAHQAIVNAWGSEPAPIVATDTAEQPVIEAMVEVNDWMGKPDETVEEPAISADEWAAHHETFHTEYARSGDEITEPVLEVSVAEMPQAELVTES